MVRQLKQKNLYYDSIEKHSDAQNLKFSSRTNNESGLPSTIGLFKNELYNQIYGLQSFLSNPKNDHFESVSAQLRLFANQVTATISKFAKRVPIKTLWPHIYDAGRRLETLASGVSLLKRIIRDHLYARILEDAGITWDSTAESGTIALEIFQSDFDEQPVPTGLQVQLLDMADVVIQTIWRDCLIDCQILAENDSADINRYTELLQLVVAAVNFCRGRNSKVIFEAASVIKEFVNLFKDKRLFALQRDAVVALTVALERWDEQTTRESAELWLSMYEILFGLEQSLARHDSLEIIAANSQILLAEVCQTDVAQGLQHRADLLVFRSRVFGYCRGKLQLRLQKSVVAPSASWEKKRILTSVSELFSSADPEQILYVLQGAEALGEHCWTDQDGRVAVESLQQNIAGLGGDSVTEAPVITTFGVFSFAADIHPDPKRVRQALLFDLLVLLRPFWSSYELLFRACLQAVCDFEQLHNKIDTASMDSAIAALAKMCGAETVSSSVKWFPKLHGKQALGSAGKVDSATEMLPPILLRFMCDLVCKTPKTALSVTLHNARSAASAASSVPASILSVSDSASFIEQIVNRMVFADEKIGKYSADSSSFESIESSLEQLAQDPVFASKWQLLHVNACDLLTFSRVLWHIGDARTVLLIRHIFETVGRYSPRKISTRFFDSLTENLYIELSWRSFVLSAAEICSIFVSKAPLEDISGSSSAPKPSNRKQQNAAVGAENAGAPCLAELSVPYKDRSALLRAIDTFTELSCVLSPAFSTSCFLGLFNLLKAPLEQLELVSAAVGSSWPDAGVSPALEKSNFAISETSAVRAIEQELLVFWKLACVFTKDRQLDLKVAILVGSKLAECKQKLALFSDAVAVLENLISVVAEAYEWSKNLLYGLSSTPLEVVYPALVPVTTGEPPSLQIELGCLIIDVYANLFKCYIAADYEKKKQRQEQKDKEAFTLRHKVAQSKPVVSSLPQVTSLYKKNKAIEAVLMLSMAVFGFNLDAEERLEYVKKARKLCAEEKQSELAAVKSYLKYASSSKEPESLGITLVLAKGAHSFSVFPGLQATADKSEPAKFFMLIGKEALPVGPVSINHVDYFGCGIPFRLSHPVLSPRVYPIRIDGLEMNKSFVFGTVLCSNGLGAPVSSTIVKPSNSAVTFLPLSALYLDSLCTRQLLAFLPLRALNLSFGETTFLKYSTEEWLCAPDDARATEWLSVATGSSRWMPEISLPFLGTMTPNLLAEWLDCRVEILATTKTSEFKTACFIADSIESSTLLANLTLYAHWSINYKQPPKRSLWLLCHGFNHAFKLVQHGSYLFLNTYFLLKLLYLAVTLLPGLASAKVKPELVVDTMIVPLLFKLLRLWKRLELERSVVTLAEHFLNVLEPYSSANELKIASSLVLEHSWFGTKAAAASEQTSPPSKLAAGGNAPKPGPANNTAPAAATTTATKASVNNQQLVKGKRIIWYTEYLFHALLATSDRKVPVVSTLSSVNQMKEFLMQLVILSPINSPSALGSNTAIGSLVSSQVVEKRTLEPVITKKEFLLLIRLGVFDHLWQELLKFKKNTRWLELVTVLVEFAISKFEFAIAQRICNDIIEALQQRNMSLYDFGKEFEGRAQRLFSSKPAGGHSTLSTSSSSSSLLIASQSGVNGSVLSMQSFKGNATGDARKSKVIMSVMPEDETDDVNEDDSDEADVPSAVEGKVAKRKPVNKGNPAAPLGVSGNREQQPRVKVKVRSNIGELMQQHLASCMAGPGFAALPVSKKESHSKLPAVVLDQNPFYVPIAKLLTQNSISGTGNSTGASTVINIRARKDAKALLLAQLDYDQKTRFIRGLDALDNRFCVMWQSSRYKQRARALAVAESAFRSKLSLIQANTNLQMFLATHFKQYVNYQTTVAGTILVQHPQLPLITSPQTSSWSRFLGMMKTFNGLGADSWSKVLTKAICCFVRSAVIAERFSHPCQVINSCIELWNAYNTLSCIFNDSAVSANLCNAFNLTATALLHSVWSISDGFDSMLELDDLHVEYKQGRSFSISSEWLHEYLFTALSLLYVQQKRKSFLQLSLLSATVFEKLRNKSRSGPELNFTVVCRPLVHSVLSQMNPINDKEFYIYALACKCATQFGLSSRVSGSPPLSVDVLLQFYSNDPNSWYLLASSYFYEKDAEALYREFPLASSSQQLKAHVLFDESFMASDNSAAIDKLCAAVKFILGCEAFIPSSKQLALLPAQVNRMFVDGIGNSLELLLLLMLSFYRLSILAGDSNLGLRTFFVKAAVDIVKVLQGRFPQYFEIGNIPATDALLSVALNMRMRPKLPLLLEALLYTSRERLYHFRYLSQAQMNVDTREVASVLHLVHLGICLATVSSVSSLLSSSFVLLKAQLLVFCPGSEPEALLQIAKIAYGHCLNKSEMGIVSHKFAPVAFILPELPHFDNVCGSRESFAAAAETFLGLSPKEEMLCIYGLNFFEHQVDIARLSIFFDLMIQQQFNYTAFWDQELLSFNLPLAGASERKIEPTVGTAATEDDESGGAFETAFLWPKLAHLVHTKLNALWSRFAAVTDPKPAYAKFSSQKLVILFAEHLRLCREPGVLANTVARLLAGSTCFSASATDARTVLWIRWMQCNALYEMQRFTELAQVANVGLQEAKKWSSVTFLVEFCKHLAALYALFPRNPLFDYSNLKVQADLQALVNSQANLSSLPGVLELLGEDVSVDQGCLRGKHDGFRQLCRQSRSRDEIEAIFSQFSKSVHHTKDLQLAVLDIQVLQTRPFDAPLALKALGAVFDTQPWNFALALRICFIAIDRFVDTADNASLTSWSYYALCVVDCYLKFAELQFIPSQSASLASIVRSSAPWVLSNSSTFVNSLASFHGGSLFDAIRDINKSTMRVGRSLATSSECKSCVSELLAELKQRVRTAFDCCFTSPYTFLCETDSFLTSSIYRFLAHHLPSVRACSLPVTSLFESDEPFMLLIWIPKALDCDFAGEPSHMRAVLVSRASKTEVKTWSKLLATKDLQRIQQDLASVQYMLAQHAATKDTEKAIRAKAEFKDIQKQFQSLLFEASLEQEAFSELTSESLSEMHSMVNFKSLMWYLKGESIQKSNFHVSFVNLLSRNSSQNV